MRIRSLAASLLVATAAALTGCASDGGHDAHTMHGQHDVKVAVAALQSKSGSAVTGWVRFEQVAGGLRVTADVQGLQPNSKHAIHIHETGDCSSQDGTSAGGHYNPEGHPHAGPDAEMRHAGDLGNLQADGSGHAVYDRTFDDITIAGPRNPILGLSIIVHASEDDFTTQPTGNAGGRIACGTIGVAR